MKNKKRTIIMLCAKRSGSSAIFKIFQKHPDVNICHVDQNIHYWEANFWNLAAEAIDGNPKPFLDRFINVDKSHPFLKIPEKFTEESVFDLWDQILDKLGPVVFDKSPQYLGNRRAFDLLKKYIDLGNDVRLFAFIRDPKDTVTSQYELWNKKDENDSPSNWEKHWIEQYKHLEELENTFYFITKFRYEDFSQASIVYAPRLLNYCGLKNFKPAYSHIRPFNIGKYYRSVNKDIRNWVFSEEFKVYIQKYGYVVDGIDSSRVSLKEYLEFFFKKFKNKVSPYKVNILLYFTMNFQF